MEGSLADAATALPLFAGSAAGADQWGKGGEMGKGGDGGGGRARGEGSEEERREGE